MDCKCSERGEAENENPAFFLPPRAYTFMGYDQHFTSLMTILLVATNKNLIIIVPVNPVDHTRNFIRIGRQMTRIITVVDYSAVLLSCCNFGKGLKRGGRLIAYSSTMSSGSLVGTLVNDFSLQFTMPPSSHEHGCGHEDFWSSTPGPHSTVSPSKSPSASWNNRKLYALY